MTASPSLPCPLQDKTTQRRREDESPFRLLTTRREALGLYREIWRVSALFDWPDNQGRIWCAPHSCMAWTAGP